MSGRCSCGNQEILRLTQGDMWFDGLVISVVAEALFQSASGDAKACHFSSWVLPAVRRCLENPWDPQV